jgi:hypothetical protein
VPTLLVLRSRGYSNRRGRLGAWHFQPAAVQRATERCASNVATSRTTSGAEAYPFVAGRPHPGTKKKIRTLDNRPGTAALGPVLQQETVDLWGKQHQLRPKIQFENKDPYRTPEGVPETVGYTHALQLQDQDATVCSYCDTTKEARDKFAAKTAPVDDDSWFRWQITAPASVVIAWFLWRQRSRFGLLKTVVGLLIYVFIIVHATDKAGELHQADLDRADEAKLAFETLELGAPDCSGALDSTWEGNFSESSSIDSHPGLICSYTTNFGESIEAEDDNLVFHKTLFECPNSMLCPAEALFFDDGLQMYDVCGKYGLSPVNEGSDVQGNWSCSGIESNSTTNTTANITYGTCIDAGNWGDSKGRTCDWYNENFCDITISPKNDAEAPLRERWSNWTVYSSALAQDYEDCAQGLEAAENSSAAGSFKVVDAHAYTYKGTAIVRLEAASTEADADDTGNAGETGATSDMDIFEQFCRGIKSSTSPDKSVCVYTPETTVDRRPTSAAYCGLPPENGVRSADLAATDVWAELLEKAYAEDEDRYLQLSADRFNDADDADSGIKAMISEMFVIEQKGDLMAFASGSGLSALDACCVCGGGGKQKEALQECPHVVVETKILQETIETSEFYQGVFPNASRYELVEEEIQRSRIATDLDEVSEDATIVGGNAGQEGSLCAGCKTSYIVQADGSCQKCAKQETKGAVWIFVATLCFLIVFKAKQKQTNYRTEAIDRSFADLKASENVEGKPLFSGVFTSTAKQSDMLEQLLRDAKFEGDKMKESLQVGPADVNVWNKLQKPKKSHLLQLIADKSELKTLLDDGKHTGKNLKVVCDRILESANVHDRALAEAAFMKQMLPPDKNAESKKKGNGKEKEPDELYDKYGTPRQELIKYWDKLPGGCDPPKAWYRKKKKKVAGVADANSGTNHLVRYSYTLSIDVDATNDLRPNETKEEEEEKKKKNEGSGESDKKSERVDEKLADVDELAKLKLLETQSETEEDDLKFFDSIPTDTLYLRYVAAQKWIEENADDIEKAKQYKELDLLPLDELLVRAGDKSLLNVGSELLEIRATAEKDGKKESDNKLLILPDKDLQQAARFRMLPFEDGVKHMAAAGTGLNYDDLLVSDDKKGDASKKGAATGGTEMVTALNPLNADAQSNVKWEIGALERINCLEQGKFEEWSKDGKKGQQGVDTFVKHLKTRMSSNARFVKGVKSRKDLNEQRVRVELGVCERLEMYRRAARQQKMRESDLLRLELQVAETYSQFRAKERKKLAMKASGSNVQQQIAKAKQDVQDKASELNVWQDKNHISMELNDSIESIVSIEAMPTEWKELNLQKWTYHPDLQALELKDWITEEMDFGKMLAKWQELKHAYLEASENKTKLENKLQSGAQAAMEKAEKKARDEAEHEQAEIDKKKHHAEDQQLKDAEDNKKQKDAEAAALAADEEEFHVDPGGGLASVLTHLQNVYDRHPELDPQKGPKVLVHKAFQFENRSLSLQRFKVPFRLPIPEIIPKLSVFMEVVLQSTTMVTAFVLLGAILFHNVWSVGIYEYEDFCLKISDATDTCRVDPSRVDEASCTKETINAEDVGFWSFAQDERTCEWIPDADLQNPALGNNGGICRQEGSEDAQCELMGEDACNAADVCVVKSKDFELVMWGPTVGETKIPLLPWFTSKFNRCTDCSIKLWVVNPWFRAMLTPVNALLFLQLVHMNLNYYLRTYARFLKPLTGRYQEQQQRCAHITHHQSRKQLTPADIPLHRH